MADTTIANLTELLALANGDQLVIVDVSDTSMSPNGTTKRIALTTLDGRYATDAELTDLETDLTNLLQAHLDDTADAHDASSISVVSFGSIAATDVQAALEEIVNEVSGQDPRLQLISKSADEAVNNSTTLQDDDHLLFPVAASKTYDFRMKLHCSATSNTPDMKFGFTVPVGGTIRWAPIIMADDLSNDGYWGAAITETPPALATTGSISAGGMVGTFGVIIEGTYIGGANAGNVQLQFAQNTANASDSKILLGSSVVAYLLN